MHYINLQNSYSNCLYKFKKINVFLFKGNHL